jgi:hypothetical protein
VAILVIVKYGSAKEIPRKAGCAESSSEGDSTTSHNRGLRFNTKCAKPNVPQLAVSVGNWRALFYVRLLVVSSVSASYHYCRFSDPCLLSEVGRNSGTGTCMMYSELLCGGNELKLTGLVVPSG